LADGVYMLEAVIGEQRVTQRIVVMGR